MPDATVPVQPPRPPADGAAAPARPLAERLAPIFAAIDAALDRGEPPPTLAALAAQAGCSPFHLQRVFRQHSGLSPAAYARARRAERLARALPQAPSITAAVQDAGYGAAGRFYAEAAGRLGMAPRRWRAGGAGETIHFALARCSLGELLVAATPRGLCALWLGDAPGPLLDTLQRRFHRATLVGDDPGFATTVARAIGLVEAPAAAPPPALPLDVRGTVFQERVWAALRGIPPGHTLSYGELAARLGCPRAVRAVATACAANPVAVAIPCHRVVRQGGELAGYRWGLARKQALLAREQAPAPPQPPAPPPAGERQ